MKRSAPTANLKNAAQGWVRALNTFGARDAVDEVLTPRGIVWRYVADEPDTEPQRIGGRTSVSRWLASSPGKASFSIVSGSIEADPEDSLRGRVRYRVAVDAFENFGTWDIRLARSGLIQEIKHHPDPVPERWRVGEEVVPNE